MIKVLSELVLKHKTPHILLPSATFDTAIKIFIMDEFRDYVGDDDYRYNIFLERYKDNYYLDKCSIQINEWTNCGNLSDLLKKHMKTTKFTEMHWKSFFFQIISVLAVIQYKYPEFKHNSFKLNDIIVDKIYNMKKNFTYIIAKKKYIVDNICYQIRISDFVFSCIPGLVENKRVDETWAKKLGINKKQNRYYDIHFFFNTLINIYFPDFFSKIYIPDDVKDFVKRIVPEKYRCKNKIPLSEFVNDKYRLVVDDEYLTPQVILETEPYFSEFRVGDMWTPKMELYDIETLVFI